MAERLAHALHEREMTPPDLIGATKLSKGTIYFILDGTTKPEKVWGSTVEKICRALRIRSEWLLRGDGAMDLGSDTAPRTGTPAAAADVADLQVAFGLLARSLAVSIPGAAETFLAHLRHVGAPLDRGTFLGELAKAVESEIPTRITPRL